MTSNLPHLGSLAGGRAAPRTGTPAPTPPLGRVVQRPGHAPRPRAGEGGADELLLGGGPGPRPPVPARLPPELLPRGGLLDQHLDLLVQLPHLLLHLDKEKPLLELLEAQNSNMTFYLLPILKPTA